LNGLHENNSFFVAVFLFQMLSKGFLHFFSSFLGCAIGIILPELKQDPQLGWEFLLKHDSTYGVII
jgi:hypothetical protein